MRNKTGESSAVPIPLYDSEWSPRVWLSLVTGTKDSTEGGWRSDQQMESHMASEHTSWCLRRMEVRGKDLGIYCNAGWLIADRDSSQQNVLCSSKCVNLVKGAIQRWGGHMSRSIECRQATRNRGQSGLSWSQSWQQLVMGIGESINVRISLT